MFVEPVIALCMPHYGNVVVGASQAFWTVRGLKVVRYQAGGSILPNNFNRCWCWALNQRKKGVTHFAMLHSDVCPQEGWLKTLLDELKRLDADMVSAVVPLKGSRGLTSTAIWRADGIIQRLTLKEVYALPETFQTSDVGAPLLLNTGCWIADLRKPWVDAMDGEALKYAFRFEDGIRRDAKTGDYYPISIPEDWLFSDYLNSCGARIFATRKVPLYHDQTIYSNTQPWGEWETDLEARNTQ